MDDTKTLMRTGVPDVLTPTVVQMSGWQIVLVRVARTYLQSLLGFLTATATGLAAAAGVPIGEFGGALKVAAMLAVAPTVVALIQNAIELLANLDVSRPGIRG